MGQKTEFGVLAVMNGLYNLLYLRNWCAHIYACVIYRQKKDHTYLSRYEKCLLHCTIPLPGAQQKELPQYVRQFFEGEQNSYLNNLRISQIGRQEPPNPKDGLL